MSNLFSCVVPVKGSRQYLDESLASLKRQNFGCDLEVIVQDGDIETDSGQSDAINKGFAKAKGEWLFWLNADDVLLPGALNKVRQLITHNPQLPTVNWIAGDTVYLNENGVVQDVRCDARWRFCYGNRLSVWTGGPSAFFKREFWKQYGGLDTQLKYVMDIDLWTRWAQAGERFVSVGDYLWGFRVHPGSTTMCGRNYVAQNAEKRILLDRYCLRHLLFWRNLVRGVSIVDGSWFKRKRDSRAFRGMHWSKIK